MSERKPRRFFWFEGVTRDEVQRSLTDTTPTRLRQQGPRRQLVWAAALVIAALALTIFIPQEKIRTYTEMALLVATLLLYLQVRKSVRHVSDAPNEMLDERQVSIRDAAYTVAYRTLVTVGVVYGGLLMLVSPGRVLAELVTPNYWWTLLFSFLMTCACLPAMVLAWNMPSELQDEQDDSSA